MGLCVGVVERWVVVGRFLEGDFAVFHLVVDAWHAGCFHPSLAEGVDRQGWRFALQDFHQVVPCCVAIGIGVEIVSQGLLHAGFAYEFFKLVHHDGGFGIDDVAIEKAGGV